MSRRHSESVCTRETDRCVVSKTVWRHPMTWIRRKGKHTSCYFGKEQSRINTRFLWAFKNAGRRVLCNKNFKKWSKRHGGWPKDIIWNTYALLENWLLRLSYFAKITLHCALAEWHLEHKKNMKTHRSLTYALTTNVRFDGKKATKERHHKSNRVK